MSDFASKHHPESHDHAAPIDALAFTETTGRRTDDLQTESGEIIVEVNGVLNRHQRQAAADQLRLYQSLCGGIVGQYWPQALLESGGSLNRPQFPSRQPMPKRHDPTNTN